MSYYNHARGSKEMRHYKATPTAGRAVYPGFEYPEERHTFQHDRGTSAPGGGGPTLLQDSYDEQNGPWSDGARGSFGS